MVYQLGSGVLPTIPQRMINLGGRLLVSFTMLLFGWPLLGGIPNALQQINNQTAVNEPEGTKIVTVPAKGNLSLLDATGAIPANLLPCGCP